MGVIKAIKVKWFEQIWNNSDLAVQNKNKLQKAFKVFILFIIIVVFVCVPVFPSWLQRLCDKRRGEGGPPPESCAELQRLEEGVERPPGGGVARQRPLPQRGPLCSFPTPVCSGFSRGQWVIKREVLPPKITKLCFTLFARLANVNVNNLLCRLLWTSSTPTWPCPPWLHTCILELCVPFTLQSLYRSQLSPSHLTSHEYRNDGVPECLTFLSATSSKKPLN